MNLRKDYFLNSIYLGGSQIELCPFTFLYLDVFWLHSIAYLLHIALHIKVQNQPSNPCENISVIFCKVPLVKRIKGCVSAGTLENIA